MDWWTHGQADFVRQPPPPLGDQKPDRGFLDFQVVDIMIRVEKWSGEVRVWSWEARSGLRRVMVSMCPCIGASTRPCIACGHSGGCLLAVMNCPLETRSKVPQVSFQFILITPIYFAEVKIERGMRLLHPLQDDLQFLHNGPQLPCVLIPHSACLMSSINTGSCDIVV